ncbi:2-dehydropantoate 2-reductase [Bisporella sp. PMI_857]|nr:2-dehydropantoate 2-reductase [Bisporella sp. PMI_857]
MPPRVLIFGTGSIGAVCALIISRAIPESNIVAICRSNYDATSKDGFTIHSTMWGENQKVRPTVARSINEAVALSPVPFDYILVCSKVVPSDPSTAELIKPAISETTSIVLVQNGIAIEEPFAKLFPNNPLLSTVVYLPATQTAPGVIQHRDIAHLHIGTYPSNASSIAKDAAAAFAAMITAGNGTTELHEDVQLERWSKVIMNAAWNPVCALSRSRDRSFLDSSPDAEDFIRDVMLEVVSVANASGFTSLNAETVERQLGMAARRQIGVEPSMMADASAGRNMEVDAIVGNVIKLGKEHKVSTPLLRTLYALVNALDDSFTKLRQVD